MYSIVLKEQGTYRIIQDKLLNSVPPPSQPNKRCILYNFPSQPQSKSTSQLPSTPSTPSPGIVTVIRQPLVSWQEQSGTRACLGCSLEECYVYLWLLLFLVLVWKLQVVSVTFFLKQINQLRRQVLTIVIIDFPSSFFLLFLLRLLLLT